MANIANISRLNGLKPIHTPDILDVYANTQI
jgi:hypothetical protein